MPYVEEWRDAEIVLEHHGVTVFCTYKDDDFNQGPRTYLFTLEGDDSECGRFDFDVREFDVPACRRLNHGYGSPDRVYLSGEPYESMDPIGQAYARAVWEAYHLREPGTIRQALREAIDAGLIDEAAENARVKAAEFRANLQRAGTG